MRKKVEAIKVIETFLAIFLPVLLIIAALFYGMSDTKIPADITMRIADFDFGIFDGISKDIREASVFDFRRDYRNLISYHLDPFFVLASILPAKLSAAVLCIAYFLRFSLASLFMSRLLRKQLDFGPAFSTLLGVLYSISAPVLTISSYEVMMNAVVLIPIVFDRLIEFYKGGCTLRNGAILAIVAGITILLSGNMSLLYVVPFLFCSLVFFAACMSKKFSKSVVSFICAIPYFVAAILIGGISIVNSFVNSRIVIDEELLETLDFRITMFDFFTRSFDGKPLINGASSPAISLSVFVLFILLLFFINSKIPLRVRITALVIIILYHFSFASKAWYRLSVLFKADMISSETSATMRFACLSALLIFAAGISIKNIYLISSKSALGCVYALIAIIVISNSSASNEAPGTFSLFYSALAVIIAFVLIKNADKIDSKTIAAIILFGTFVNLSFVLPISRYSASLDEDSTIFDKSISVKSYDYPFSELDFLSKDENSYMVLKDYIEADRNEIEKINDLAYCLRIRTIFNELNDCRSFFAGGRAPMINGEAAQESQGRVEFYSNVNLAPEEMGKMLILFSDHEGEVILEMTSGNNVTEITYQTPVIAVIEAPKTMNFQVRMFTPRGNIVNPNDEYELYICDKSNVESFANKIVPYENEFSIPASVDGLDVNTVLTGRKYSETLRVKVNGEKVDTFNVYGKLAFAINPNLDSEVEIYSVNNDIVICSSISIVTVICSILIIILRRSKGESRADN